MRGTKTRQMVLPRPAEMIHRNLAVSQRLVRAVLSSREGKRAFSPLILPPEESSMRILACSVFLICCALCVPASAADAAKKKIVFISGGPSHGFLSHDHLAGCKLLADRVNQIPGYEAT